MKDPRIRECKKTLYAIYGRFGFFSTLYTFIRLFTAPLFEVERYIPESGQILDLGCGSGVFCNLLFCMSPARKIRGYDMSAERIAMANSTRKPNAPLTFHEKNALDVDFMGSSVVTVIDLLHHMPYTEQESLLRKIYERMENPGLVILKDLEKKPFWKYIVHYIQDTISYRSRLYFRSSRSMKNLLCNIGFRVRYIRLPSWLPYPHVLYVCEK